MEFEIFQSTNIHLENILASMPRLPLMEGTTRVLSFLPLCHIFERVILYIYYYKGIEIMMPAAKAVSAKSYNFDKLICNADPLQVSTDLLKGKQVSLHNRVIEKFAKLDKSVAKPSIMIYPSDTWCKAKGYVKKTDDQNGGFKTTPDYEKAILDEEFMTAMSSIKKLFIDRDYENLVDLQNEIRKIEEEKIKDEFSDDGRQLSMLDKIINKVSPDIKISAYWKVIPKLPNYQLEYQLEALDSYTSEPASQEGGFGPESRSASIGELILQSVNDKMDGFIGRFQKYFDKMQAQGRKVELTITTSSSFEGSLDKEYNVEGESYPLKEIIGAWMTDNALSEGNVSASKNKMTLKDIRIPLTKVNKLSKTAKPSAVTAQTFLEENILKNILLPIKKNFVSILV